MDKAELAKQLAYLLYNIASNKLRNVPEVTAHNSLVSVWSDLITQADAITENDLRGNEQLNIL